MSPKQFVPYPFYLLVHWWFRVISPWVLASLFFYLYLNFSSPSTSFPPFLPSIPSLHTLLLIAPFCFPFILFFTLLQPSIIPISIRPLIHPSWLAFTHSSTPLIQYTFHHSASVYSFNHSLFFIYSLVYHPSIHTHIRPPII